MTTRLARLRLASSLALTMGLALASALPAAGPAPNIGFNKDIRPILSEQCMFCHGPDDDERKADLRLDTFADATAPRDGLPAITPGSLEKSELWKRINSTDPDYQMPPPDSHKSLSPEEIDKLAAWIKQGAQWEDHWAYMPVRANPAPPPPSSQTSWPLNEIDQHVLAAITVAGHQPSPPADKSTLVRRVTFDLTGLPPTLSEIENFHNDDSPQAYEKLVDRLLASPRFGERLAMYWLDLVRYADTIGYHSDNPMAVAPYREYVIRSFNQNKPYDQFIREQLAGDLLQDNPTREQLIATAYNRLNQKTEEGGAQDKEYLAIYQADRVRNVSSAFLGSTLACAQCHDHKYDPLSIKDFYSMGAFFADVETSGRYKGGHGATLNLYTDEEKSEVDQLEASIEQATAQIEADNPVLHVAQQDWEATTLQRLETGDAPHLLLAADEPVPENAKFDDGFTAIEPSDGPVLAGASSRQQSGDGLADHELAGLQQEVTDTDAFYAYVYLDPQDPPQQVALAFDIKGKNWRRAYWGRSDWTDEEDESVSWRRVGELPETGKWIRLEVPAEIFDFQNGETLTRMRFIQFGGNAYWDDAGLTRPGLGLTKAHIAALRLPAAKRSDDQSAALRATFRSRTPLLAAARQQRDDAQERLKELDKAATKVLYSKTVEPREIRILPRGNWMDDSGEIVQPAIPEVFGNLDTNGRRANRLDLANWIVSEDNPLTARVFVNRLWMLFFGRGISASVEDFGNQGSYPANPELLDHLAQFFMDSGWDIKATVRHIVTSQTYRQSSKPSPQLREADPYNELFARQGRWRLDAEMIRDNALALSGLLVEKISGPSAKPYQPDGYYAQLNFPKRSYEADTDENQYRRGVYMHWQRTFLHPMLKAFDAPSREECAAQRARSNTPLQSLTLLNDPTFVEAARLFAERMMQEGGPTPGERIQWAYQTALARPPEDEVMAVLSDLQAKHLDHYQAAPAEAEKLLSVGLAPRNEALDTASLAAYTSVARVILNLHESITRY